MKYVAQLISMGGGGYNSLEIQIIVVLIILSFTSDTYSLFLFPKINQETYIPSFNI